MENYAALKNAKFKKVAFKIVFEKKGKQKNGLTEMNIHNYLFLTDYLFIICPTPRIADGKQINKQKKKGKYFRHCRLSIVC